MNKSIDEMIIELSEFLAFNKPTLKTTLETMIGAASLLMP